MKSFIEGIYFSQDNSVNYRLSKADINLWINAINEAVDSDSSTKRFISLRLVNSKQMKELNYKFRKKNKFTNVLAFPSQLEDNNEINNLLGDIALCVEVSQKEAEKQEKNLKDHLAHLFVHGTLHLMGFDHKKKSERSKMETIEKRVLIKLGIDDPYS